MPQTQPLPGLVPANKEKTVASAIDALTRAVTLLEQEAASLSACHTVRGRWPADEDAPRAAHAELLQVAKALRELATYHAANPLGGPAKVFDAVADAIRAGDSVESAMRAPCPRPAIGRRCPLCRGELYCLDPWRARA